MSANKAEARSRPAAQRVDDSGAGRRFRAWREQHAYSLVSSLGRFFQRPFATLLTVGVMAVAMALPLGLGLALTNIERLSGSVLESREIGVFLKPEVDASAAARIATQLRERGDVAAVAIRTPEQGMAEFRELSELAGALELLDGNPLPTVLIVQPNDDGAILATELRTRAGNRTRAARCRVAATLVGVAGLRPPVDPGGGRSCSAWACCWWSAIRCAWRSARAAKRSRCCSSWARPMASFAGHSFIWGHGTDWPRVSPRLACWHWRPRCYSRASLRFRQLWQWLPFRWTTLGMGSCDRDHDHMAWMAGGLARQRSPSEADSSHRPLSHA